MPSAASSSRGVPGGDDNSGDWDGGVLDHRRLDGARIRRVAAGVQPQHHLGGLLDDGLSTLRFPRQSSGSSKATSRTKLVAKPQVVVLTATRSRQPRAAGANRVDELHTNRRRWRWRQPARLINLKDVGINVELTPRVTTRAM